MYSNLTMYTAGRLADKVVFITGASRGIGKAIALKCAQDGAKVVIAAKTAEAHPKLPGTIYTTAEEVEKAGGKALPCIVDVRSEEAVQKAIDEAVQKFGGIDVLINNASAIHLTKTLDTPMKRYDLMHQINTRGTFLCSKFAIPYLKQSKNPHILNLSPPLNMRPIWFKNHVAYTMAKYGMSMCVLGMAEEFRGQIAVNALWPRTAIATAAMEMLTGAEETTKRCRKPDIMADAAYAIITRDAKNNTGNFYIDENVLKEQYGVVDFSKYLYEGAREHDLMPDFFLEEAESSAASTEQERMAKVAFGSKAGGAGAAARSIGETGSVSSVFKLIGSRLNDEKSTSKLLKNNTAVFQFDVENEGSWYIDLGNRKVAQGEPPRKADAVFSMAHDEFVNMFRGNLNPTTAFMSGQMRISGDMGQAMKLQSLLEAMRSH